MSKEYLAQMIARDTMVVQPKAYGPGYNASWRAGLSSGAKFAYGLSSTGGRALDHRGMRRNARDAYHDSSQARAIVDRFTDSVADTGLQVEAAPKAELLGITPEQAEAWASDVEPRFDSWARSKNQHRAETMTFYQGQRLYELFQQRDNDVFVRLYYNNDRALQNPLQFEFIDPDQIRGDAFTTTYGLVTPDDGIMRDGAGRELAFKIWYQNRAKYGEYQEATVKKRGKSGRIHMLHGFCPEYAGQGRGYSRLGSALQEFQNITDFTLSQIQKAINQSSIAMYVKPSQHADASNPLHEILSDNGVGPAKAIVPTESASLTEDVTEPVSYYDLPEATVRRPGSVGVFNLAEGEDLKAFATTAPSDSFEGFVAAFTSYLCASQGMPIEVLLMKFSNNYSASRATLLLFWRTIIFWREEMASDFLNPVYEMWLCGEIAAGRIQAPGWSDPVMRAAWLNCRWVGSPMPNIDPVKTAMGNKLSAELGATTLDRIAREINGSSGAANRRKLAKELTELPEMPWAKKAGMKG